MPSGKVHAIATTVSAGVLCPVIVMVGKQPLGYAFAFAAGCLMGLLVNPDLDVRHREIHADAIIRRTAGGGAAHIWEFLWWPYARLIPHHRHPLSHWPVLGTMLRLGYMLALPVLAWWALSLLIPLPNLAFPGLTAPVLWALGGLLLVDALHGLMDKLF